MVARVTQVTCGAAAATIDEDIFGEAFPLHIFSTSVPNHNSLHIAPSNYNGNRRNFHLKQQTVNHKQPTIGKVNSQCKFQTFREFLERAIPLCVMKFSVCANAVLNLKHTQKSHLS